MKSVWMNTLAWALAALVALALAFASPTESALMGRLPSIMATRLDQQPVLLPAGLPSGRTLALISFHKGQRPVTESWVEGLQLGQDSSINWMRMPVLEDPGHARGRSAIENRLRARYTSEGERSRLVPVFTDRAAFIRAAGLNGPDTAYAVILNRHGEILARAEGQFDQDKAAALRETLRAHDY